MELVCASETGRYRSIEWFEGDILAERRDLQGNVYVEKWADYSHSRTANRVIVVPSTEEAIALYEAGRISMLDLLVKHSGDKGYLVDVNIDGCVGYEEVTVSKVNPSYLPSPTAMHDRSLSASYICKSCDPDLSHHGGCESQNCTCSLPQCVLERTATPQKL
jgi:hypothetical protein